MAGSAGSNRVQHVFVLMLENRSFDHMLGFSGITGTDAATGAPTQVNGLSGAESNSFNGQSFVVSQGADRTMPTDPHHEFLDVLLQLCGPAAQYPPKGPYPTIDNSGYVASYVNSGGSDPAKIMKCFAPSQLPVLNALAREFVVCDCWHASLPGPTWPNRMFVHAASSGGLDHSPSVAEIAEWESIFGFRFPNGTIFDALKSKGVAWRLYGGDDFPMVAALKGIQLDKIRHYDHFAGDLLQGNYPYGYIFIEPSYDIPHDYRDGTSQHPLADVANGEGLIKATYEAIRNSPLWGSSLLIITWDEHGGFYDHAIPGPAKAPGDTDPDAKHNQRKFTFEQYGPRVPAIVISPLIPKNLIDHRIYDHSSIPATLESLFGMNPLTQRDAAANHVDSLVSLAAPRSDAPSTLPAPMGGGLVRELAAQAAGQAAASRPSDRADEGNVPGILQVALRQDLAALTPEQRQAVIARVSSIKTRGEAMQYLREVQGKAH